MQGKGRGLAAALSLIGVIAVTVALAQPAFAHEEEKGVPAITDVQEAIAILASQPELADEALDKVKDAQESEMTSGVDLDMVRHAQTALESRQMDQALTLLERSIGACAGAPVIDPGNAPRTPPPLTSPCSSVAHLVALPRSPVGGAKEPVLLGVGVLLVVAGLLLARRIR